MDRYADMRRLFEPAALKLTIVAESPPESGKYFYDLTGRTGETLYRELLKAFDIPRGRSKREGLTAFQAQGLLLLDATYTPVDKITNPRERNTIIMRDFPQLVARLDLTVPVVLIKANVCDVLEPLLVAKGFNVLNRGARIPFPGSGNQNKFQREFAAVMQITP